MPSPARRRRARRPLVLLAAVLAATGACGRGAPGPAALADGGAPAPPLRPVDAPAGDDARPPLRAPGARALVDLHTEALAFLSTWLTSQREGWCDEYLILHDPARFRAVAGGGPPLDLGAWRPGRLRRLLAVPDWPEAGEVESEAWLDAASALGEGQVRIAVENPTRAVTSLLLERGPDGLLRVVLEEEAALASPDDAPWPGRELDLTALAGPIAVTVWTREWEDGVATLLAVTDEAGHARVTTLAFDEACAVETARRGAAATIECEDGVVLDVERRGDALVVERVVPDRREPAAADAGAGAAGGEIVEVTLTLRLPPGAPVALGVEEDHFEPTLTPVPDAAPEHRLHSPDARAARHPRWAAPRPPDALPPAGAAPPARAGPTAGAGPLAVAAPPSGATPPGDGPAPDPCAHARTLVAEARAARREGRLHRVAVLAAEADRACPDQTTRRLVAEALADLWLDARAAEAWERYGAAGTAEERRSADEELARLRARPDPRRGPADRALRAEASERLKVGRQLREDGKPHEALPELERAAELWPRPAALHELALAHGEAGRLEEERRAGARAVALAESLGARAIPAIEPDRRAAAGALAFGRRGLGIAFAAEDGLSRWEARGGTIEPLEGSTRVTAIAFGPDGRHLAAGGPTGSVLRWRPGRSQGRALGRHEGAVRALAFSPDLRRLASGADDGTVRLWPIDRDAAATAPVTLAGHAHPVRALAFAPDGRALASADLEGTIVLWDPATGARQRVLAHPGGATALAFSPRGTVLASAGVEGDALLFDVASGAIVRRIEAHPYLALAVAFRPDGRVLATASADATVRLWDVASGAAVATLRAHSDHVTALAFSSRGRVLATAGLDTTVKLWDAATGVLLATLVLPDVEDWLAVAGDGSVDGSLGRCTSAALVWRSGEVEVPCGVLWDRRLVAGLVGRVLGSRP